MMRCEACGRLGPDKLSREAQGWDWFTGFLLRTVHFCPEHTDSDLRKELWKISQDRPVAHQKATESDHLRDITYTAGTWGKVI